MVEREKLIAAHDGALTEAFAIHESLNAMWDHSTGEVEKINPQEVVDLISASRRLTDFLQQVAIAGANITK